MKLIFCGKNDAQISGFAFIRKLPAPSTNWKKYFQRICVDQIFKTVCEILNNMNLEIF